MRRSVNWLPTIRGPSTSRSMLSDLEIYRAAKKAIERHGDGAVMEAARMIDRMTEIGDFAGCAVWRRIQTAIEALQAAPGGKAH